MLSDHGDIGDWAKAGSGIARETGNVHDSICREFYQALNAT